MMVDFGISGHRSPPDGFSNATMLLPDRGENKGKLHPVSADTFNLFVAPAFSAGPFQADDRPDQG